MSNIIRKKNQSNKKVTLSRVATDLQYMGDVDFGTLDSSKDGLLVSYNSSTDRFEFISPDRILSDSVSDSDVPDVFVRNLEDEIDLGALTTNLDGGSF